MPNSPQNNSSRDNLTAGKTPHKPLDKKSDMTNTHTFASKIASTIIALRLPVLVFFIALLCAMAYFLSQFKIDASAETLLVKNNKLYIQSQLANQQFSPDEFILVTYKPKSHDVFSDQTFTDIKQLSSKFESIERVKQVTSILTVPLIESTDALTSGDDVSSLTWMKQAYSPEQMKVLLAEHPIFTDLLINKKQTATAIQIVFNSNRDLDNIEREILSIQKNALNGELTQAQRSKIEQLIEKADPLRQQINKLREGEIDTIRQLIASIQDADIYIGGSYVVGQHLIDIIKSDLSSFGIAIAAVIAMLLLLIYRSVQWVIYPVIICASGVLITMGLFGMLNMRPTVISANFIALQLILTLAVMIHLIGHYRHFARIHTELTQYDRIKNTLSRKLAPCFYATLTTSVGFGALIFSGIQPVVDFGYMMLIAMLVTMSVSLLLFPALLSFFKARKESEELEIFTCALQKIQLLIERAPSLVMSVVVIVFVLFSLGITKLNVENSFINYFAKDTQVHKELAFIDQEFGGSTPLDIIIDVEPDNIKTDLVISAKTLNRLHLAHATVDAFEASGSITSLINFTALAKKLNNNKPLTEYELDAVYTLLDKEVVEQLVGAYLSTDNRQLRISVRIQDTTAGLDREVFLAQLNSDLQTAGLAAEDYNLTNLFVLYQDILSRLFDSQVRTLGIVYIALGLVLLVIFRSLKVALIALVPNVLTTLGILGIIGWLGIPLDLMTITIAAIAMGIAVDDTIHFVDNYLKAPTDTALTTTFSQTGLAIMVTSLIIAAGFAMFIFSDFLPSVYFGGLTASAMLFALIADVTLLPILLKKFVKPSVETTSKQAIR